MPPELTPQEEQDLSERIETDIDNGLHPEDQEESADRRGIEGNLKG